MNSESNYPDVTEPGLRRKKKKVMSKKDYTNKADTALNEMVSQKTGINPFKKKAKGS